MHGWTRRRCWLDELRGTKQTLMKHREKKAVPRLIDVASEAGVSRMAAAHVINGTGGDTVRVSEPTRRRILEAARRLNYHPNRIAQQLRGASSRMLGVIYDTASTAVMWARLTALDREAVRCGYRLMIGQVHSDPEGIEEYFADFFGRGLDGIVCLFDPLRSYDVTLQTLIDRTARVVFFGRRTVEHAACVRVDTADGMRQSVGHLIDRGRQRPGLVVWNAEDQRSVYRREGFLAELEARKVPIDARRIWAADTGPEDPSQETLDRAIDELVVQLGADSLIIDDDVWAVRFIQRLKDRGFSVPGDVAVIGYDNLEMGTVVDPALTTVDQDHEACARAILELLLEMINGGGEPSSPGERVIKPKLIVRQST